MKGFTGLGLAVAAAMVFSGCSLKTMAVNSMANALSESGDTFSGDDDLELVRDALPFALKMYESLLQSVPRHRGLLLATCSGFTQYAYAFVQTEADTMDPGEFEEQTRLTDRALKLFLRGRGYCMRALELRRRGVERQLQIDPAIALEWTAPKDVPLLYWTGASWGAAISIGLDRPDLVADMPAVRALAERALELQDDYGRGALHSMMISLEAVPESMGGSVPRARAHFERAVQLSDGTDPAPFVTLATGVAQPAQNREEFVELLERALAVDPDREPSSRLAALIAQKRARYLLSRVNDLFVSETIEEVPR